MAAAGTFHVSFPRQGNGAMRQEPARSSTSLVEAKKMETKSDCRHGGGWKFVGYHFENSGSTMATMVSESHTYPEKGFCIGSALTK